MGGCAAAANAKRVRPPSILLPGQLSLFPHPTALPSNSPKKFLHPPIHGSLQLPGHHTNISALTVTEFNTVGATNISLKRYIPSGDGYPPFSPITGLNLTLSSKPPCTYCSAYINSQQTPDYHGKNNANILFPDI